MTHCFSAKLLLRQSWPLDIQAIARATADLVPSIEDVQGIDGQPNAAVLSLDDTQVVLQHTRRPLSQNTFSGNKEAFGAWVPDDLIASHRAHIVISCGGERDEIGSKELYAAAVHVAAAATCRVAPVGAIFWDSGEILGHPNDFEAAIGPMMAGQMPTGSWIGYRPIRMGEGPDEKVGMLTCGLRHFLGREIELAPGPTTLERAKKCLESVIQRLMDQHLSLHDGDQVEDVDMALRATVRLRDRWLRRDKSAFVLITDDSVVDRTGLRTDKLHAA